MGSDRGRAEALLEEWRLSFLRRYPDFDVPDPPNLLDEEVEDLCLALDSGIFNVDADGTFKPLGLRARQAP